MKNIFMLTIASILMQLTAHAQTAFDDYSFTTPENWLVQKNKDFLLLAQSQDPNAGCVIQVLLPSASSGNLEQDAKGVFALMYPGWEYRNTGEKHHDLVKGHTPQGLEYCMMQAPMKKMRPDGYYYDYEDGSALVIGVEKQMVIIAARHNRLLACECDRKYNLWKRFFKSFTIKNVTAPASKAEEPSKRIIGVWKIAETMAVSDYVFAANGNFSHGGAIASSSTSRDQHYEYLHIKSYSFEGDGNYTITGNTLTLKKKGAGEAEKKEIRFEKVNHGDTGWKERMYMMGRDAAGEYEACYEKQ